MICEEFYYKECTVEEFYNWAVKNNIKGYKIAVQYCDDGGDYYGEDNKLYCMIDSENKKVVL